MTSQLIARTRQILGGTALGLLAGLLVLGVGMRVVPLTGHELFTITGGSMEPTIPVGSMVAVESVDPRSIEVGEVITVRGANGVVVTHRVAGVIDDATGRSFALRGDANASPDGALASGDRVIGRVVLSVPVVGYLRVALAEPQGLVALAALVGSLFLAELLLAAVATRPWAPDPELVARAEVPR